MTRLERLIFGWDGFHLVTVSSPPPPSPSLVNSSALGRGNFGLFCPSHVNPARMRPQDESRDMINKPRVEMTKQTHAT